MTEVWFDPNLYAWIPGTLLGVAGGLLGSTVGVLAPRGKAKGLVLSLHGAAIVLAAVFLGAGIVAMTAGQPYGVWYGFGLPGLVGLVVFGGLFPVILKAYRQAERRRLVAQDI